MASESAHLNSTGSQCGARTHNIQTMAGEGDHQASEATKRTKGGRKGKAAQQVQIDDKATDSNKTESNEVEEGSDSNNDNEWYDYHTLAKIMEAVPKLTLQNYYSWSTLIKATLRVVPHAIWHLEGMCHGHGCSRSRRVTDSYERNCHRPGQRRRSSV